MAWPGVSDYQEAVQSPKLCFGDPQLQQGSPVLTKLGLPRPISGGNASVYQIRSGRGEYAVRCFLRNIPDLQQRYAAIDAHLRQSPLAAKVGFEYQQQGIRIRGQWYPVLKMEWVRGKPLNEHIQSLLGDAAALRALAADWVRLVAELEQHQIAHGDLQHGNVLVAGDRLVLIDYDGMWVPALRGSPAHELGHPAYQHPRRDAVDFGPTVDRFAALAIHTAILALAEQPQLWAQNDNADNILFSRADFEEPQSSQLLQELQQLRDPAVAAQAKVLLQACVGPVAAVPRLADVVAGGGASSPARPAAAKARPAAAQVAAAPSWKAKPAAAAARTSAPVTSGGGAQQWISSLMAAAPAVVGGSEALSERWRHRTPGAVTRAAAWSHAQRPVRERAIVQGLLSVLVQPVAYALQPWALPLTLGGALLWWWRSRRTRASVGGVAASSSSSVPIITGLALAGDGRHLAVVGGDGIAEVLDWQSGKRARRLLSSNPTLVAVLASGGDQFVTVAADGTLQVHDQKGAVERALRQPSACAAAATADGRTFAVGGVDGVVRCSDPQGQDQRTFTGHQGRVTALAWSVDGQQLLSGGADHKVCIWSLPNRALLCELPGHDAPIESVAWSRNGRFVAAGAQDGRVRIWDARRQKLLHTIGMGTRGVGALAFAGDSAVLVAGCADGSVRVLDAIAGKVLSRQAAHQAPVVALVVGDRGAALASADAAGTLLAWKREVRPAAAAAPAPAAMQLARP